MANLLENRTNGDDMILQRKFVRMKLQETAQEIEF